MSKYSETKPYKPRGKRTAILARAWELVQSVDYSVSLRWLFYKLFQEGYYTDKKHYKTQFGGALSDARHGYYKGWRPDTLTDGTRATFYRGHGPYTPQEWVNQLAENVVCSLNKWHAQDYYVELWYEARAMHQQFAHYTEHITLRPMSGKPSIPFKWEIAKDLENFAGYGLPIVILYFGDLDETGQEIPTTLVKDVRKWCSVDFKFIYCGLTSAQVKKYNVPQNPEKPGYQWEGLPDAGAKEIIESSTAPFIRLDRFSPIVAQEQPVTDFVRGELAKLTAPNGI